MNYKILVGNLETDVTEEQIGELFARAPGTVVSIDIAQDPKGNCRGYAFVGMGSEEEAKATIAALNGQDLHGRSINLSLSDKPGQPSNKRKWYQFG